MKTLIQTLITLIKNLLDSLLGSATKSATGIFGEAESPVNGPAAGVGSPAGDRRKAKEDDASPGPQRPQQAMMPPEPPPPPAPPSAPAPAMPASTDTKPAAPSEPAPEPQAPPEPALPPIVGGVEKPDKPGGRAGAILEDVEEELDLDFSEVEFPLEEKIDPDYFDDLKSPEAEMSDEIRIDLDGPTEKLPPRAEVTTGTVEKAEDRPAEQPVEFMAYYPKEVAPEEWKPLTAYVYKAAFADVVAQDAKKELGSELSEMREVGESARQPVAEGALITATPYLTGFRFNPPSITVGFYEDWHRLDFKLQAKDAPLQQATNGYVNFMVEGIIVADIPLSVFVGATSGESETVNTRQKLYQAIFCSYSHDDTLIIERVERAYKALGLDYLRDVYTLKSGQDWDDQLLTLIEQADIFQLFWSKKAAKSPYVRQEWEYALKLDREGVNFIRPVYWEQPMPPVPPELGHIHFAYQPDLDD